ncbi:hypothetical protein [Massilia sp. TWR1-2-2]|uniref:hypothetical protein n=1 Tax=Massilia sp. TWR1-2-2 TaxID=2804584 RepID=UPI003CE8E561
MRIPGYRIELPEQPYRLMPGDFIDFKGAYDMSNGDTMVLRQYGRKLFAEIGDGPRTEIIPATRSEFVSLDEQLKMTLNRNFGGLVKGELLMASPPQTMGQAGGTGRSPAASWRRVARPIAPERYRRAGESIHRTVAAENCGNWV